MKKALVLLFFLPLITLGQKEETESNKGLIKNEEVNNKLRVALSFNQSFIPKYHSAENKPSQLIPTDGVEVQYFFSENFSIKSINEIEFQSYLLRDKAGLTKVRENPFLTALVLGYELNRFGFFAGIGYEFEKNESLWVKRFGFEYVIELNENIDISPAYVFDSMGRSHVSHTLALALGYKF